MTLKGTQANRIANSNPKLYHLGKWDNLSHPQKLEVISEIVRGEGRDPSIAELAVTILKNARVAPRDYKGQAAALLKWVQDNIYYINEPGERLQSPKYTLKRGFGDCDDMAIILCSMFEAIGLPWKLVLSGNNGGKKVRHVQGDRIIPGVEWAHIYCAVGNQPFNPSQWLFAEPTIQGVPLGWDVVSSDSNLLPELLNPRYSGISLAAPSSSAMIGVGVGVSAGEAYARTEGDPISWNRKMKEIAVTVLIGTLTAVATDLTLGYIKSRYLSQQEY